MLHRRTSKIALGIATVFPALVAVALCTVIFRAYSQMKELAPGARIDDSAATDAIQLLLSWGPLVVIPPLVCQIACLAIYLVHVSRNQHLSEKRRTLWLFLMVGTGLFAILPYFFKYIWSEPPAPQLPNPASS